MSRPSFPRFKQTIIKKFLICNQSPLIINLFLILNQSFPPNFCFLFFDLFGYQVFKPKCTTLLEKIFNSLEIFFTLLHCCLNSSRSFKWFQLNLKRRKVQLSCVKDIPNLVPQQFGLLLERSDRIHDLNILKSVNLVDER